MVQTWYNHGIISCWWRVCKGRMEEALPMRHKWMSSERASGVVLQRMYTWSKVISWVLSFMSANAIHHKFSVVPGVQQCPLLQDLCKQMHTMCWRAFIMYHPYGEPLEWLHRLDFISFLSQYLKFQDAESGSLGKKAVCLIHECRCHIKHSTHTEHVVRYVNKALKA